MSKESVARQFFWDFLENLGEEYKPDSDLSNSDREEANFILTDLFFAGLLKIGWNHKTQTLVLQGPEKQPS